METFSLLLCYKLKYPDRITLLRGNHECRSITTTYGLFDEIISKYKNDNVHKLFCDVFDYLPIVNIIYFKIYHTIILSIAIIIKKKLIFKNKIFKGSISGWKNSMYPRRTFSRY